MRSNENIDVVETKTTEPPAAPGGESTPPVVPRKDEKGCDGQNSGGKKKSDSTPLPATPSPTGVDINNNDTVYVKATTEEQDRGLTNPPERISGNAPLSFNQQDGDGEEESESSSSDGILGGLQTDDMFHGIMSEPDIDKILVKDGDFVVNTIEKTGKGRVIGISVLFESKRFWIQVRQSATGATFDMINYKKTVLELVRFHVNEGVPVSMTKNMQPIMLRRPILREEWELRHEDIQVLNLLGAGAFGEVRLARLKQRNKGVILCACKILKSDVTKETVENTMKEARIMRQYNHPNLVRFYGVQAEVEPLMLLMEFVKGGSLDNWLKKNSQQITVINRASMCYDAACGLEYLHAHDCIHRDIAARNCLLDTQARRLKISDFGLSSIGTVQILDPTKPAPIRWLSPEAIKTGCFGKPADVWSFGVLCWEIYMDAEIPYKEYTMSEVQSRIMNENFRLRLPLTCQTELQKLITSCWIGDINKRPTIADCVSTLRPFFDEKYVSDDAIKKTNKNEIKIKKPNQNKGDYSKEYTKVKERRISELEGASCRVKSKSRRSSKLSRDAWRRKTKSKNEDEDDNKSNKKMLKKRQKSYKMIKSYTRDSDSEYKKKNKTRERQRSKRRQRSLTKSGYSPPNDKTSGRKKKPISSRSGEERKKQSCPGRYSAKKDSDSEDTRKRDKCRLK